MTFPFKLKVALVFAITTLILLAGTWTLVSREVSEKMFDELGEKLTGIAIGAVQAIDGDLHEQVANGRNMDTPGYHKLKKTLQQIQNATRMHNVTNVYTLRPTKQPNIWEFVIDPSDSPDRAILGKTYDVSELPGLRDALDGPSMEKRIYQDEWGRWLSGYAPIRDRKGDPVAVLGIDASAAAVHDVQIQVLKDLLLILLLAIAAIIPLSFIVGRLLTGTLHKLVIAAGKIGGGDFDVRVDIRSRDELGKLGEAFNQMAAGLQERDLIKQTFSRYLSHEVAEKVMGSRLDEVLAGERRRVTILFSDVRGFTSISERLRPEEILKILNEYFVLEIDAVLEAGGNIDKFMGDGLMAVFGAPVTHSNDAERAVRCALKMQESITAHNLKREAAGLIPLRIGIGIHTGIAVAGNIGSSKRREYSVIGDTVNLAARVQGVAAPGEVLITQTTYEELKDLLEAEILPPQYLKGKADEVVVYRINSIRAA